MAPSDARSIPQSIPQSILLIDDDVDLVRLLTQFFTREGLALRSAGDGRMGLAAADDHTSLVLLDLMLPDLHGTEVFRQLRAARPQLPIIMLTAKGDPVDRVVGLELGADDYVAKPFDPRELVARVRSVLRRARASAPAAPTEAPQQWGQVSFDTIARELVTPTGRVPLTNIEFRLLQALIGHRGVALSRETLTRAAQAGNYRPLERAVDVQIGRLRRKLRQADPTAQWIVTLRGEGYVWAPPPSPGNDR